MDHEGPCAQVSYPQLVIGENSVQKTYSDPLEARLERIKSQAAFDLANRWGAFTTPEISDFSSATTTWKFIPSLSPLRVELSMPGAEDIARIAGRALGHIHSGLRIPVKEAVTDPLVHTRNVVPIHGDYSLNNAQLHTSTGQLVLLDWSTARWLGAPCSHANQHVDMSVFLADLFYQRPREPRRIARPEHLAALFLSGYGEVRDPLVGDLPKVARTVLGRYLRGSRQGWRRILRGPSLTRFNLLLVRLERGGLGRG